MSRRASRDHEPTGIENGSRIAAESATPGSVVAGGSGRDEVAAAEGGGSEAIERVLSLESLRPLSRDGTTAGRLHDEIYDILCQALIAGELVPGQAFSIRALAERFGTSLIPVRDALKRLVAEHALTMLPNRTVCVPEMTRARFQELLQVRLDLESMLVRRAVEHLGQQDIVELENINAAMQEAARRGEIKPYLEANRSFHFRLYGASESVVTLPIVESLWMQAGPFLNGVFNAAGTKNARDNHEQVLKALRRRDPITAAQAVASDLMDAADVILARRDFVFHED